MRRWQCPIYNGTLKTLIWIKMWKRTAFFWLAKCLFLWVSPMLLISKKCAGYIRRETANDNKQLNKQKHEYPIHSWSHKAFKGALVNWALSFLHGGSLEITLTVQGIQKPQCRPGLNSNALFSWLSGYNCALQIWIFNRKSENCLCQLMDQNWNRIYFQVLSLNYSANSIWKKYLNVLNLLHSDSRQYGQG